MVGVVLSSLLDARVKGRRADSTSDRSLRMGVQIPGHVLRCHFSAQLLCHIRPVMVAARYIRGWRMAAGR